MITLAVIKAACAVILVSNLQGAVDIARSARRLPDRSTSHRVRKAIAALGRTSCTFRKSSIAESIEGTVAATGRTGSNGWTRRGETLAAKKVASAFAILPYTRGSQFLFSLFYERW